MLEFNSFRLDPDRRELFRDGKPLAIQAKLFDTLVLLTENRDRVVEKQELLDSIWPGVHVEESTLFQTISALRKVLGCGKAGGVRYIATIPGRGYRFVAATHSTVSGQIARSARHTNGIAAHPSEERRTHAVLPAQDSAQPSPPEATAIQLTAIQHTPVKHTPPELTAIQHTTSEPAASEPTRPEAVNAHRETVPVSPELTQVAPQQPAARRRPKAAAGLAAALLVLAGAALWRSLETLPTEPPGLRIKRLTSLEGTEWQPGWSPDGRSFAYSGVASGNADIFVKATAGGDPLRRTFDPADDLHPRWSPDGRYIAFLSDRGAGASVYVISPYTGRERHLAETHLHRDVMLLSGLGAQPWSPDSNELLFPRRSADGTIAVWKVELSSGEQTQVTRPPPGAEDREASWSFNGRQIAFRGERDAQAGIWVADGNGRIIKLAADTGNWPAWSPDDRSLYVSANRGGPKNIWRVELDSGAWYPVTRGAGEDMYPAVASNGALAYSSFRHSLHLYRTYLANGKSERLVAGAGRHLQARVSPDGARLVYQSGRSGSSEIWVLDLATGEERQLTFHPGADTRPDWSPDGEKVVFLSRRDGAWRLWTVDAKGGAPQRLSARALPVFDMRTAGIEGNAAPRWSPDGDRIGYISPAGDGFAVWLASLDGGAAPLPSTVGAVNFGWYLDGERIILTRLSQDGGFEMVAMNLRTGRQRLLHRGPHYELAVAPNGRRVSFSHNVSHVNQNLYVLRLSPPDADGLPRPLGEPQQLTDGQGVWHVHNGGWFPDGESVVYTRDTDQADILLIENP